MVYRLAGFTFPPVVLNATQCRRQYVKQGRDKISRTGAKWSTQKIPENIQFFPAFQGQDVLDGWKGTVNSITFRNRRKKQTAHRVNVWRTSPNIKGCTGSEDSWRVERLLSKRMVKQSSSTTGNTMARVCCRLEFISMHLMKRQGKHFHKLEIYR